MFRTAETKTNNIMKKLNDESSTSSEDISNRQVSEVKEDCEYFDDTDEEVKYTEIDSTKTSLFKKFRTQNIRQKKSQKFIKPNTVNGVVSNTAIIANSVSSTISSTIKPKNPNGSLYDMSKNQNKMPADTKRERSKDGKGNFMGSIDFDQESDETPIKLDSDQEKQKSNGVLPVNGGIMTRSTSSIKISASNPQGSNTAFTSNSLPRSLTPTSEHSSSHSYRSATVSSMNKSIENSAGSTQYHPINSSITAAVSLVKNQAFQKKKSFFY